jgi:hypothetical protein
MFLRVSVKNVGQTPAVGVFIPASYRLVDPLGVSSALRKMCEVKTYNSVLGSVGTIAFPGQITAPYDGRQVAGQAPKITNLPDSYGLPDTLIGCVVYRASFSTKSYYTGFVYRLAFRDAYGSPIVGVHFGNSPLPDAFAIRTGQPGGIVEILPEEITMSEWEFGNIVK